MWIRLDDGFAEHPAIADLSDGAFRLLVASFCYAGRNLTDGHIPRRNASRLVSTSRPKHVAELVEKGRWIEHRDTYEVRSFLEFNPTAEQVKRDREAAKERQRRRRGHGVSHAVTPPVTHAVSHTTPTRPDPKTPPTPPGGDTQPAAARGASAAAPAEEDQDQDPTAWIINRLAHTELAHTPNVRNPIAWLNTTRITIATSHTPAITELLTQGWQPWEIAEQIDPRSPTDHELEQRRADRATADEQWKHDQAEAIANATPMPPELRAKTRTTLASKNAARRGDA